MDVGTWFAFFVMNLIAILVGLGNQWVNEDGKIDTKGFWQGYFGFLLFTVAFPFFFINTCN
tara:strand:- start:232 stop:414 length:183 start_codon:yes stop_codon:yes gene_type:complete